MFLILVLIYDEKHTMGNKLILKTILGTCLISMLGSCTLNQRYNGDTYKIQRDGLYGFIDSLGRELIQPQYFYAEDFSDNGVALVVLDTVHITRIDTALSNLFGNTEYERVLKINYGYINKANKSIFPQLSSVEMILPRFSTFSDEFWDFCSNRSFYEGLAVVTDSVTHKCGYINLRGDTIIPCIYKNAGRFSDGLAVVQKAYGSAQDMKSIGKYGFINRKGNEIGDFQFNNLEMFRNGRSIGTINYVHHEDQDQEIEGELTKDKSGNVSVDKSKRSVHKAGKEGYDTFGFKRFLVDANGHIIGNALSETYYYFNFSKDGYAVAVPNRLGQFFNLGCKFLKKNGEFLSPLEGVTDSNIDYITREQKSNIHLPKELKILDATRFTNGFAAVKIDKKAWIYVDRYLLVHSPLEDKVLEEASAFAYGIAPVKIAGKWGYINTKFDVVIPCKYDSCCIAEKKLCKVYQSNDDVQIVSYIDRNENIVWQQTNHKSILDRSSNNALAWRHSLEPSDENNQWTLVIIICIISVLFFLIIEHINKIKRLFSSNKVNDASNEISTITPLHTTIDESEKLSDNKPFNDNNHKSLDPVINTDYSKRNSNFHKKGTSVSIEKQNKDDGKKSTSIRKKTSTSDSTTTEKKIPSKVSHIKTMTDDLNIKPTSVLIKADPKKSFKNETLRVLYSANNNCETNNYVRISYPKYNCVVFPYRTHQINRRGYCEEKFERLINRYKSNNIHVVGNANIVLANGARPYEPDIAIVCDSEKNIRIDIEIDEPYSGLTHEPIHFIGCGDDFRDLNLTNAGWIVIRFAEKQIHEEPLSCISFIYKVMNELDDSIKIPNELIPMHAPSSIMRWSELEAKIMASSNERERYLDHTFGVDDSEDYTSEDITQTQKEKELSKLLDKLTVLEGHTSANLDNSEKTFAHDTDIKFYANEHIYVYKDYLKLTPVSEIIEKFFKKFDDLKWSEKKARENGVSQRYMLELWDCKGTESREVGTFLHSQIELYFNRHDISDLYHFKYNGTEISKDEFVSIKKEWAQFMCFLNEKKIIPFRTEWRIFDLEYKIAGTIDLLCKNDEKYDIYDWKRSDKINPNQTIWQYGINGLEDVPDTRFYHYCLQQNLYRYMLEKNYQIEINKMYLVIFHPSYQTYRFVEVPRMENEIKNILFALNKC